MQHRIVLAGWGQVTQPKQATEPFMDPLDMMVKASEIAAEQAGRNVLSAVDTLLVVRTQSRNLVDPLANLSTRLGFKPSYAKVSGIGGEVPQHYVNQAAGRLARGESEIVLICGGETFYPRSSTAVRGDGMLVQGIPDDYDADDAVGSNAVEQRHGLTLPIHGFPMFENALWAKSGLNREQWLNKVGSMWSQFSEVAAEHPNAWTRNPQSVAEIIKTSENNRPICFPYTKRMVSLVSADIGAALIMTTESRAAQILGGGSKPVYFLGGGFAKDRQRFLIDKADFTYSASLASAASKAQQRAGLTVNEIEGFDLYSCFPCAVNVARGQLGIEDRDPKTLTTTGGLGFFGGPGSNYALHGITTLAERIATGKYETGMSTALGWFMHKYAVGIYSSKPLTFGGQSSLRNADLDDNQNEEAGDAPVRAVESYDGAGTIKTYTIVYARDHSPAKIIVYGDSESGERFIANMEVQSDTIDQLTNENCVGRRIRVGSGESNINQATLLE